MQKKLTKVKLDKNRKKDFKKCKASIVWHNITWSKLGAVGVPEEEIEMIQSKNQLLTTSSLISRIDCIVFIF